MSMSYHVTIRPHLKWVRIGVVVNYDTVYTHVVCTSSPHLILFMANSLHNTSVSGGISPGCRMECVWESHTPLHTLLIVERSLQESADSYGGPEVYTYSILRLRFILQFNYAS